MHLSGLWNPKAQASDENIKVGAGRYGDVRVPQQRDVSAFLEDRTGFILRPVTGSFTPDTKR